MELDEPRKSFGEKMPERRGFILDASQELQSTMKSLN